MPVDSDKIKMDLSSGHHVDGGVVIDGNTVIQTARADPRESPARLRLLDRPNQASRE